eukprot:2339204-Rhodomonas_salina.1
MLLSAPVVTTLFSSRNFTAVTPPMCARSRNTRFLTFCRPPRVSAGSSAFDRTPSTLCTGKEAIWIDLEQPRTRERSNPTTNHQEQTTVQSKERKN